MRRRRTWDLRLRWLGMLLPGLIALMLLTFCLAGAQETKETGTKKPWTGKLKDGRVITQADLDKILQAHALWLQSHGKEGKKAELFKSDLSGANLKEVNLVYANLQSAKLSSADLTGADLHEAILDYADLSEAGLGGVNLNNASLQGANLSGATLRNADMINANLMEGNLSGAFLGGANLSWAFLWKANLRGAILRMANLKGAKLLGSDISKADLSWANLDGTYFEPSILKISDLSKWRQVKGVSTLTYQSSSHGLVELRETYKKAGMREPERQVTFALNHNRRVKLWKKPRLLDKVDSLFNLVCFEWTCQYGMNPGRPLKILGLGLFLFTPFYLLALRSRNRETGIWLVLPPDRILGQGSKVRPFKLTSRTPFRPLPPGRWPGLKARVGRGLRRVRLAFYFSLLSAFNLGWRELNVGNWISRLQKNEYTLRATGWVRTVAGLQSLLSIYLLALWVLTYFGRPFD